MPLIQTNFSSHMCEKIHVHDVDVSRMVDTQLAIAI